MNWRWTGHKPYISHPNVRYRAVMNEIFSLHPIALTKFVFDFIYWWPIRTVAQIISLPSTTIFHQFSIIVLNCCRFWYLCCSSLVLLHDEVQFARDYRYDWFTTLIANQSKNIPLSSELLQKATPSGWTARLSSFSHVFTSHSANVTCSSRCCRSRIRGFTRDHEAAPSGELFTECVIDPSSKLSRSHLPASRQWQRLLYLPTT